MEPRVVPFWFLIGYLEFLRFHSTALGFRTICVYSKDSFVSIVCDIFGASGRNLFRENKNISKSYPSYPFKVEHGT